MIEKNLITLKIYDNITICIIFGKNNRLKSKTPLHVLVYNDEALYNNPILTTPLKLFGFQWKNEIERRNKRKITRDNTLIPRLCEQRIHYLQAVSLATIKPLMRTNVIILLFL